jgi:hypothetical protein
MRRTVAGAAAAVALLVLAGCGSDEPEAYQVPERFRAYCAEVEAQQAAISEALGEGGSTGLIRALPSFEALEAEAPDDIADDWAVVVGRSRDLVDALEEAGVDPATYDREQPPAGLTPDERDAIDAAASALVSPTTGNAMAAVQQHSRDVCKAPLAL